MKSSYNKIFSPLPRSRQPSKPAFSYEHIEAFTKDLEAKQHLGNQAALASQAHYEEALSNNHRHT